jgi:hypothetical protein
MSASTWPRRVVRFVAVLLSTGIVAFVVCLTMAYLSAKEKAENEARDLRREIEKAVLLLAPDGAAPPKPGMGDYPP